MTLRQSEQKLFHPDLLHKGCFWIWYSFRFCSVTPNSASQQHRRFRRRRVPFSGICRSFRPGAVLIGSSVGNMLAANYSSTTDTKHSSLSVCSPALLFLFSYCDILPIRACRCWLQVFLRIRERNRCISASSRRAIRIWYGFGAFIHMLRHFGGIFGAILFQQIIIPSKGFTIEGFKIGFQGIWILFAVFGLLIFLLPMERLLNQKINKRNTISQTE